MLEVRGLEKRYGSRLALRGVDLDVAAGEIVGLLGPNGAGKTTLVSIVAGLRRPDAGTVHIGGVDAARHPRRARASLGFAPQETGVYPILTGRQNLRFFAELAGLRGRDLRTACDRVAEGLGLTPLLDRRAMTLSGGEKRRLHTALALVHRPALVLLDEPTTGADVHTRTQLLEYVQTLAAEGAAIVYSTHYLGEIEQLGASVTIIEHGRTIARGSLRALLAQHSEAVVSVTFSGAVPECARVDGVPATVDGDRLQLHTHDAGATTAALVDGLGAHVASIRSLEVIQPSLEAVFVRLTGRRFEPDAGDGAGNAGEARDVA